MILEILHVVFETMKMMFSFIPDMWKIASDLVYLPYELLGIALGFTGIGLILFRIITKFIISKIKY